MKIARKFVAVATLGLLAGCVNFGGAEAPPFLLALTPSAEIADGSVVSAQKSAALVVDVATAGQKLNNLRVPVETPGTGVAYLKDAFWVDKPVILFRDLLAETIAARNNRLILSPAQAGGKAETYLSGDLVDFGLNASSLDVIVTFDATKIRDGQPIEKRRFQAVEPVGLAEAAPVAQGLNRAANKVAAEVADWVR